jgi:hypothetical protein
MTVLTALKVNGNRYAAYSITDIIVSPNYCNVTSFTLFDIIPTNNSTLLPSPVVYMNSTTKTSATCTTNECKTITVSSVD